MPKKKTRKKIKPRKRSVKKVVNLGGNLKWVFITIIAFAVIGVMVYGGTQGWFKSVFTFNLPEGVSPGDFDEVPTSPTCTFSFNKAIATVGESVTGTLHDGSLKRCVVAYNYENTGWKIYNVETLDINGDYSATQSADVPGTYVWASICGYFEGENFIAECRTNDATIEIIAGEPSDVPDEVGDPVGGGSSGSGSGTFGDDITTSPITVDWTPGGPYILGAKITRSWDYINPQDPDCHSPPEQYPMEWTFYDSNGMAWQKYDYTPVSNVMEEVCPVTYHPDAPWSFIVSVGIQNCDVDYSWSLQPYICEVID